MAAEKDAPPTTPGPTQESPAPRLDVEKLHSLPTEQQDLYLLTFTSDLAGHVTNLDSEKASAQQGDIKKQVLEIINLSSPSPTRVIRNNLGTSIAGIFTKGNRKLLYETINELIAILNSGKEKDVKTKHAATHCLGVLMEAAGDSAVSLSASACAAIFKMLKVGSSNAGLRAAVYKALGRVIRGIGSSIDDVTAKDIWKSARNAAVGDKAVISQMNACWCLEQLITYTTNYDNSNEFEKLQSVIWKATENSSRSVRHAAASCLAATLTKGYTENQVKDIPVKAKKPQKAKKQIKDQDDDDDPIERTASPALQKSVTGLSFTLVEMFKLLATQYHKTSTTNRTRASIIICYKRVLTFLGEGVVEKQYATIASHLFDELLGHSSLALNRYRLLTTRKYVRMLMQDIVAGMLGESARTNAARFLVNDILKDYPPTLKERPEPSKHALTASLGALTDLMERLGAAYHSLAEMTREALFQVLQHPSYTVQVYAARCMSVFVVACPSQLLPTITLCLNSVRREVMHLATHRQAPRRCIGFANGLAALLSASSKNPMYGSIDVYTRVLEDATKLLKSSGTSNLRTSATQLQVAWAMIGGLMSLGPNFVKIHLSQLLLMWKNALPPPPTKDELSRRSILELSFLMHVRECALGSLMAFLHFNSRLVTADVSKRLSAMLQSTVSFAISLPTRKGPDQPADKLSPALQLQDFDYMVRRRVLQCFNALITAYPISATEIAQQSNILSLAVSTFADPENYLPSSLSVSIASSAGSFESIWDVGDNSGYGVTGLVRGFEMKPVAFEKRDSRDRHWMVKSDFEAETERTLRLPICEAWEHDLISIYLSNGSSQNEEPQPPATELINAAVSAFALAFPLQSPRVQGSVMEQIATYLTPSASSQKDPARRSAVQVNVVSAILLTVKVLIGQSVSPVGTFQSATAEKAIQNILHSLVVDSDECVRYMAAEALGRICSVCGTDFTSNEVKLLIDSIVANREPQARAGLSLALSFIHTQRGGMAASFHLKNIVGILMSLSADSNPTVHFWALESLCKVADSAGLTFSGFVASGIGLLGQLYVFDSHNAETADLASSNSEMTLETAAATARCVDAIINVLGPDLQDMAKPRDMILTLVRHFQNETNPAVLAQSTQCLEHVAMYAPGHMEFSGYVKRLQLDLISTDLEITNLAITGLANLMRRDTPEILRVADSGLEDQLWDTLDNQPNNAEIRGIFSNWLQQTSTSDTAGWVQRCSRVLTKTKARVDHAAVATTKTKPADKLDIQDEEVAGFAAASGAKEEEGSSPTSSLELMSWQVRLFGMELLEDLLEMVAKDAADDDEAQSLITLQANIADVVKIAFSASTAGVVSLRIRGLRILDRVLQMFGSVPDPDFTEAMLLEQYQAQISSALTPAFAADSSPELAAEAVSVCATFISTGIVTDIDRMGRIHKVLVSALESFSIPSESSSIGDLQGLTSNAQVMVRMSVYSAWAGLQIASTEQKYLEKVVKPHVAGLTPLWLSSLQEYARLRFEPDVSSSSAAAMLSTNPDSLYAALNRETLLQFYQDSWLRLVDAISSLIDEDSEFVFDALDGKTDHSTTNGISHQQEINYREEPTAFFFVLFGITFEALATRTTGDEAQIRSRRLEILRALRKILQPSVAGNAIYQDAIFSETMDLLDRMVLTEGVAIQTVIVEIARDLCLFHPSARAGEERAQDDEVLSDDIDQLFELTRIIVLVLAGLIPGLAESNRPTRAEISDESVTLIRLSLEALVEVAEVFPSIIKADLHACIFHLFTTILGTGACQATVVPQALPLFRRFVNSIAGDARSETRRQTRNVLARFMVILKNAQKRESDASLPCEKNTILASTIFITTAHAAFDSNDENVLSFITELTEALANPMTTKMAAGCVRSLLLIPGKATPAKLTIAGRLLPRMITVLTSHNESEDELEGVADTRVVLAQALVTYAISSENKAANFAIAISTLLARANKEGEACTKETAGRLLELAAGDQLAFRTVVMRLGPAQKTLMEKIIREGQGSRPQMEHSSTEDKGEPTIALKMNF